MGQVRNVLFIMCDQLRADHLSCYGHPHLHTPNLDLLASRGVRFDRAYVQSGVCGPSRMSFYTGRYMTSHGATWNRVPLSASELTLGDYLRGSRLSAALAGKTHVMPDVDGLARFGVEAGSELGTLMRNGGFVEIDRYDGHSPPGSESGYSAYLRSHGYTSADPWSDYVISAVDAEGKVVSGWNMRNARLPARVKDEHSETAYMTDQAVGFIRDQGDKPWVLHLSYVKPHWPYLAPAPYNAMYGRGDCLRPNRSRAELNNQHPVLAAYRLHEESQNFSRDEVIDTVKPTYMGLIKQIDDHLGRLWQALEQSGRWNDTLVLFTSDHGEFTGDHWLGEKEMFYEEALRVPLILYDPDAAADITRGKVEARFAEGVDVLPTILEALAIVGAPHLIEGRSLLPLTRGAACGSWRDCVFSELDYSFRHARQLLGRHPRDCRAWMVRTDDWKYVHWLGLRPQLYDLQADSRELDDLGADPRLAQVRAGLHERLFEWMSRLKLRTTISDADVELRTNAHRKHGIHFGVW
jgi:arylsulfatase A-like enzyme